MAWLDDRLRDHPKIVRASAPAFRHWALALCYCSAHGTAGRLDEAVVALNVPTKIVNELVKLTLWDREPDGLWVHDWQEHNSKRDEKDDERRAQARERSRRYRARVRASDPQDPQTDQQRDVTRDDERDESVTSRVTVTRDEPRAGARPRHARDHDQGTTQQEPPAAAAPPSVTNEPAAAAIDRQNRLEHIGLDRAQFDALTNPALIDAWLDLADTEADRNPAAFVLNGVRSGVMPSPRVRAQTVEIDPVKRRRRFVESEGWRLDPEHLEDVLVAQGADEDELVGLLELAADLRRGAAA